MTMARRWRLSEGSPQIQNGQKPNSRRSRDYDRGELLHCTDKAQGPKKPANREYSMQNSSQ
jgi:hypothetical protein